MPKKDTNNKIFSRAAENFPAEKKLSANNAQPAAPPSKRAGLIKRNWRGIVAGALILVAVVYVWRLEKQNRLANEELKQYQNNSPEQQTAQLLDQLGRLIVLPQNEQPTIATVTDLAKLQDQPFFQNARVGDKVIIYSQSQTAILFRPAENKIIEVSPFNSATQTPASAQQLNSRLTVEIRNGSGTGGAASAFKSRLLAAGDFSVTNTGNAKATYPKTLLYVSDAGKLPDLVESLRQMALAQIVTSLPAGEPSSSADALLILGQQ